jgi:hypothetical protein
MTRKLDFTSLDAPETERKSWPRREINPVVQMSLRMPEDLYDRFRALCKHERRTNGEQLQVLLETYLRLLAQAEEEGIMPRALPSDIPPIGSKD